MHCGGHARLHAVFKHICVRAKISFAFNVREARTSADREWDCDCGSRLEAVLLALGSSLSAAQTHTHSRSVCLPCTSLPDPQQKGRRGMSAAGPPAAALQRATCTAPVNIAVIKYCAWPSRPLRALPPLSSSPCLPLSPLSPLRVCGCRPRGQAGHGLAAAHQRLPQWNPEPARGMHLAAAAIGIPLPPPSPFTPLCASHSSCARCTPARPWRRRRTTRKTASGSTAGAPLELHESWPPPFPPRLANSIALRVPLLVHGRLNSLQARGHWQPAPPKRALGR